MKQRLSNKKKNLPLATALAVTLAVVACGSYGSMSAFAAPPAASGAAAAQANSAKINAAKMNAAMAAAKKMTPAQRAALAKTLLQSKNLTPAQKAAVSRAMSFSSTTVVASTPVPPHDPFKPAVNVKQLKVRPLPRVSGFVSVPILAHLPPLHPSGNGTSTTPTIVSTATAMVQLGRVSGIILSNGVHAIYELNGNATILQPGDPLPDGVGRVLSIQADGVTVRLIGNKVVQIPVSTDTTPPPSQMPGGYPPGAYPPGSYPPGAFPPGSYPPNYPYPQAGA